jgi:hypothetical protein
VVHQAVEQQQLGPGRLVLVGDVHGCLDELRQLLQKAGFMQGSDNLVLVGDLVNKGPKSAEVGGVQAACCCLKQKHKVLWDEQTACLRLPAYPCCICGRRVLAITIMKIVSEAEMLVLVLGVVLQCACTCFCKLLSCKLQLLHHACAGASSDWQTQPKLHSSTHLPCSRPNNGPAGSVNCAPVVQRPPKAHLGGARQP